MQPRGLVERLRRAVVEPRFEALQLVDPGYPGALGAHLVVGLLVVVVVVVVVGVQ